MKKYILTIMIWSLLVILTELPLTYFCPSIQTIDILIIDIYMMLSIVCRAGAKGIMDVFAKLTKRNENKDLLLQNKQFSSLDKEDSH